MPELARTTLRHAAQTSHQEQALPWILKHNYLNKKDKKLAQRLLTGKASNFAAMVRN